MGRTPLGSLICFSDRLSRRLLSRALQLCTPVLGICCHQVQVSGRKGAQGQFSHICASCPLEAFGCFYEAPALRGPGREVGDGPILPGASARVPVPADPCGEPTLRSPAAPIPHLLPGAAHPWGLGS